MNMIGAPEVAVTCAHCALPVPPRLVEAGAEHQFCCAGCRAVFATVTSCGLENYYRLRDAASASLMPPRASEDKFESFDTETFHSLYVTREAGSVRSVDLFLEGVTCAACIWLVEKLPTVAKGVIESRLSLRRAVVRITWDSSQIQLSQIARTLETFGYVPHPAKGAHRDEAYRREFRGRLIKLGVAGAIAGNLMLLAAALYAGWAGGIDGPYSLMLRWFSLALGITTLAWPGAEFFRSAWTAVRTRTINLDLPIVFALAAGGVGGVANVLLNRGEIYFDSVATLVFLLLIGRFLQFQQQRKSENAVELLFSMTPASCRVIVDEEAREIPIEALAAGHLAEVLPGQVLPADGVVEAGQSSVSQALLTGESQQVSVGPGSEVFGGSQNGASPLRIRVTEVGAASRVGRLMRLLERGLSEKPEIVRFSDRVGKAFVIGVSLIAVGTFVYWSRINLTAAIDHTIAFLIVTCPCVLALATPMTLAVAIGGLAKKDVLVKSGGALERLAQGGRLLLDKTGTITEAKLSVVSCEGDNVLLGVVARIESHSIHPVGKAIAAAFANYECPPCFTGPVTDVVEEGGRISARIGSHTFCIGSTAAFKRLGIQAPESPVTNFGRTEVLISLNGTYRGRLALQDTVRPDSRRAVMTLEALGFEPEIWSGDAQSIVNDVAAAVNVDRRRSHGGVSPEDKLAAVQRPNTVMIGDGVNDAAALAAAGVGIAVHGSSEASLAAADVYVARPGLAPVVDLVRIARKTMWIIRGNFIVSFAYNVLAGVLAATGHMNPLIAAILMPLSSATVLSVAVLSMKRALSARTSP